MKSFLVIPRFLCYIFILFGFGEAQDQEWTTAFSLEGEHGIAKNTLLTTLPSMTKEWKVTFEVNPTDYGFRSYASVLHLTIGGKGTGSGAKVRDYLYKYTNTKIHKYKYYSKVGDRIPGIWFHKSKGVLVSTALNGKASYNKFVKPLPPVGAWTRIEISQRMVSSQNTFSITIGNQQVFTKPNTKPVELSDVKVFAGNPWSSSQKGSLRNLKIEIKKTSIDCVPAGGMHLKYFSK